MQPIIIIGMHRSGSSLLVKVLEGLGAFMGNDFEVNNESMFFNKINDWMLMQAGASWDCPDNFKYISDDFKALMVDIVQNRLKSVHLKKYLGKDKPSLNDLGFIWGWKDPRNTFTIDIWKKIFPKAKIIHIYRNPIDVINSLEKRERLQITHFRNPTRTGLKKKLFGFVLPNERLFYHSFKSLDKQAAFVMWKQYVEKAFCVSGESNTLNIKYESFLENPMEVSEKISAFCNIDRNHDSLDSIIQSIDQSRKFAFTREKKLLEFYQNIKSDKLVVKLGYGSIFEQ